MTSEAEASNLLEQNHCHIVTIKIESESDWRGGNTGWAAFFGAVLGLVLTGTYVDRTGFLIDQKWRWLAGVGGEIGDFGGSVASASTEVGESLEVRRNGVPEKHRQHTANTPPTHRQHTANTPPTHRQHTANSPERTKRPAST